MGDSPTSPAMRRMDMAPSPPRRNCASAASRMRSRCVFVVRRVVRCMGRLGTPPRWDDLRAPLLMCTVYTSLCVEGMVHHTSFSRALIHAAYLVTSFFSEPCWPQPARDGRPIVTGLYQLPSGDAL